MAKENKKMKVFAVKYLTVLVILAFGFVGGVFFVKRDHVPQDVLESCTTDYSKLIQETNECKEKFMQCVMFVNGVLEVCKGVKK